MTPPRQHWLNGLAMLLMCSAAGVSELRADPLTFEGTHFTIDSTPQRLDLFSNTGAVIEPRTYFGTIFPPTMIFGTFVSHDGGESFSDTIRFTYHEQGVAPSIYTQTFTTGTAPIDLGFAVGFQPIHRTGKPVATTLTVELLNSSPDFVIPSGPLQGQQVDSYTYSFYTLASVPEPSTWVLVLSGGVAAVLSRRRDLFRTLRRRQ